MLPSDKRFLFPLVTSLAEKTCSTGAVKAGIHRILEATGNNERHKSFCQIVFTIGSIVLAVVPKTNLYLVLVLVIVMT